MGMLYVLRKGVFQCACLLVCVDCSKGEPGRKQQCSSHVLGHFNTQCLVYVLSQTGNQGSSGSVAYSLHDSV